MNINILVNTNTSELVDLQNIIPVGLLVLNTYTGGSMTFVGSVDGSTFVNLQDGAGANLNLVLNSLPVMVPLSNVLFTGVRYLKLVSNTNQNANTQVTIMTRK